MAKVTVAETGQVVTRPADIKAMLAEHGVTFEQWSTERLPACVAAQATLDAAEKQSVLDSLSSQVEDFIARQGYKTADIVVLSEQTPNLEGMLHTFRQEHYHTEDEVRFTVDGEGIFFIRGRDEKIYEVLVQKGDLLIVPGGAWHWFDLTASRRIKCVRIFQTVEGWKALFREDVVGATESLPQQGYEVTAV